MATCLQTLEGGTPPELFPGTITPFSINALTNQVFLIRSLAAQTAFFNFVFNPTGSTANISIVVTAFQKVGGAYVDLGSVTFSDLVATFSKDFGVGEFYLCIRSNQGYTGTVVGNFTGFPSEARFAGTAFQGAAMAVELSTPRPPVACDEPIYYKIIEGSLPPGLDLTALGRIQGMLPNLDCLEDATSYSPAMNWSYEDNSGVMNPWGRVWRFKVRITLGDMEDTASDQWFCVRVHNNWNFDRDNFLRMAPFKSVREIEVVETPKLLKPVCEPCPEEEVAAPFSPQAIEDPCPGCDHPDVVTDIQLIEIPKELSSVTPNKWVVWYLENKDRDWGCCSAIAAFIRALEASPYFQALLAQAGVGKIADDPRVAIEAEAFQNFLMLTASSLIDGRNSDDLDAMMLVWKNRANQKLPTTGNAQHGEAGEATLT
ncbi:hypothetical protein FDI24_gp073 [Acidovorax phage ACP17]|uniref:Uncharacterized protein n=1 Tax=Acidovorax phage ACP17 TaxID=2010329 RepID=A0A218M2S9_9CAUD|nr:hypothetical protein FDI24_gp073 [Acidovorax phage ACP17]ASD50353.1 hypothetical protein [Acidovorax phage ACP17]